jgi:uncharacterized protein (TIGR02246 family)
MKRKKFFALGSAAFTLALLVRPLGGGVLERDHAAANEGLCPGGDKEDVMAEPGHSQTDREAIEETLSEWAAAIREADIEALSSLVTDDAEFWTHGAAPLVGREALVVAFKPFFAAYQLQQEFDCQELVLAGDLAFMRGMEINHLTPRDGGESVVQRQRAFSVLRREANGKWRFARGMTNLPPDD